MAAHSRYAEDAVKLLGHAIREGRITRRITTIEFAQRAGISRALLHRIEQGDINCGIGAVFEAAAIAGVPLFGEDRRGMEKRLAQSSEKLMLLPKAVRSAQKPTKDAF